MGIQVIPSLKKKYHHVISEWLASTGTPNIEIKDENNRLVRTILEDYVSNGNERYTDKI
jgi:flagellar hook assembly protein FlgD